MGLKSNFSVNSLNKRESNVCTQRGRLEDISRYIAGNGELNNFLISGGKNIFDRHRPIDNVLKLIVGKMPVIIIHSNNNYIEEMVSGVWKLLSPGLEDTMPLWICNSLNSTFEPFYGMNKMQIVNTLRQLSLKLGYTVTPRFEKVVNAHLSILDVLEIPYSLSGLSYLCQFDDMGEFHTNIMSLPCEENIARRIWSNLSIDDGIASEQFDLFRAVINNLAHDAEQSGWNSDNTVCECNCIQAIKNNATFVLSINDMYSSMLFPYLAEELKGQNSTEFFMLFDEVTIKDDVMMNYLTTPNQYFSFGIVSENAVNQVGNDENEFLKLTEKLNSIVLYKHGTGKTAITLSEIFGKYDYTKVEESKGVSRGFFNLFPQNKHDDIKIATENRYRVMPENIIGLKDNQAIIFDISSDQIVYYN